MSLSKDKLNNMTDSEFLAYTREKYPVSKETHEETLKLKYYKIQDLNIVGKSEKGIPYIYVDGEWIVDDKCVIHDRLIGYDGEGIGSATIFDIDEISEEEALEFISS